MERDLFYVAPETNVFCASPEDVLFLKNDPPLESGKWYYAEVCWTKFAGPYHNQDEANVNFQLYVRDVRFCPSCEE